MEQEQENKITTTKILPEDCETPELADPFMCGLCLHVCTDPQEMSSCSVVYCADCISVANKQDARCPSCRSFDCVPKPASKAFRRIVLGLKIGPKKRKRAFETVEHLTVEPSVVCKACAKPVPKSKMLAHVNDEHKFSPCTKDYCRVLERGEHVCTGLSISAESCTDWIESAHRFEFEARIASLKTFRSEITNEHCIMSLEITDTQFIHSVGSFKSSNQTLLAQRYVRDIDGSRLMPLGHMSFVRPGKILRLVFELGFEDWFVQFLSTLMDKRVVYGVCYIECK